MSLRLYQIFYKFLILFFVGCSFDSNKSAQKSLKLTDPQFYNSMPDVCANGIRLYDYLAPVKKHCYSLFNAENVRKKSQFLESFLQNPWVPCNRVELVSMAANKYQSAVGDNRHYYDFDLAKIYLQNFSADIGKMTQQMLLNPHNEIPTARTVLSNGEEIFFPHHPVFQSPIHKAILRVVSGAQNKLYLNVMLFGGVWGLEIVRHGILQGLAAKQEGRNFHFILMRDIHNSFEFQSEMLPMWEELRKASLEGPYAEFFTILESNINHRKTSALPMGLEKITAPFDKIVETKLSLLGNSDHSKVVIADPFSQDSAMIVQSKNVTDFNHVNFDEAVLIEGPFVGVAMNSFNKDILLGLKLAKHNQKTSLEMENRVKNWMDTANEVLASDSSIRFYGKGLADIRIAENNADDTVRNIEHTLLQLIRNAKKNLRIYNLLAYHNGVAKALAEASKTLSQDNIRILMDSSLTFDFNLLFVTMLKNQFKKSASEEKITNVSDLADKIIKWREDLHPIYQKHLGFIDILPQQHTKTIIIDDELLFLGSANFDANTLKGAFREFSVVVRSKDAARESAKIFDSVWRGSSAISTDEMKTRRAMAGRTPPADPVLEFLTKAVAFESARNVALDPEKLTTGCE